MLERQPASRLSWGIVRYYATNSVKVPILVFIACIFIGLFLAATTIVLETII